MINNILMAIAYLWLFILTVRQFELIKQFKYHNHDMEKESSRYGERIIMLNFTKHMKRIIQLAEQSLVHVQGEKFDSAHEDLANIMNSTYAANRQLDELIKMQAEKD